jgi:hypothetical protein
VLLKKLLPSGHLLNQRLLQELNKEEQKIFLRLLKKFVHLNNEESRAPLDRGTGSAARKSRTSV